MNRVFEWLFPRDERHAVGWYTVTAALTSVLVGFAVYAQPGIDEQLWLRSPDTLTAWYAGLAVTSAILMYAYVRLARRRGAPASIWLVPAFAAVWTAIGPLLDVVLHPQVVGGEFRDSWWNLAPMLVVLAPALIATVQVNEPGASLVPIEERRQALLIGLLAGVLLLVNKLAFSSPDWADRWLAPMADDEELGYQLLLVTFAPLVICFFAVLVFRVPRSAWLVPATAAVVIALVTGLPGVLAGPEFAGPLTYLALTLPMCAMAFLGSVLGALFAPKRARAEG